MSSGKLFFFYVGLVFFHRLLVGEIIGGEKVGAVVFGDKIEIVDGCRIQGGLEGVQTGIGNRTRREAIDLIGVVSGWPSPDDWG